MSEESKSFISSNEKDVNLESKTFPIKLQNRKPDLYSDESNSEAADSSPYEQWSLLSIVNQPQICKFMDPSSEKALEEVTEKIIQFVYEGIKDMKFNEKEAVISASEHTPASTPRARTPNKIPTSSPLTGSRSRGFIKFPSYPNDEKSIQLNLSDAEATDSSLSEKLPLLSIVDQPPNESEISRAIVSTSNEDLQEVTDITPLVDKEIKDLKLNEAEALYASGKKPASTLRTRTPIKIPTSSPLTGSRSRGFITFQSYKSDEKTIHLSLSDVKATDSSLSEKLPLLSIVDQPLNESEISPSMVSTSNKALKELTDITPLIYKGIKDPKLNESETPCASGKKGKKLASTPRSLPIHFRTSPPLTRSRSRELLKLQSTPVTHVRKVGESDSDEMRGVRGRQRAKKKN